MFTRRIFILLLTVTFIFQILTGFSHAQNPPAQKDLILATTTSTQDSGLLDALVPIFEKKTGYRVKTISVGSGQAMALGERGEADILLVHAPEAEKKFVENGFGVNRRLIMYNDFIIVGPPADPAQIKGISSATEVLKKLATTGVLFISRGDKSGTHQLEKKLWKNSGESPESQTWYQESGQGMGQTLGIASEKSAYTLTDRGTYLALKKTLNLDILVQGDKSLLNIYHVIEVNSAKWPKINAAGAKAFSDFMVSSEVQNIIKAFGSEKFGQPLFFPAAGKKEEELSY
jgi:tungstate transport system substrate-binding protein